MNDKVRQASRVIAAVQLQDIRLVESSAKRGRDTREDEQVYLFYNHTSSVEREGVKFVVYANFDARVSSSEDDNDPPFMVTVRFALTYELPENLDAPQEEINAFAEVNAIFNAWPFFREYVQSTAVRMMLPMVTIPLFRMPKVKPEQSVEPVTSEENHDVVTRGQQQQQA